MLLTFNNSYGFEHGSGNLEQSHSIVVNSFYAIFSRQFMICSKTEVFTICNLYNFFIIRTVQNLFQLVYVLQSYYKKYFLCFLTWMTAYLKVECPTVSVRQLTWRNTVKSWINYRLLFVECQASLVNVFERYPPPLPPPADPVPEVPPPPAEPPVHYETKFPYVPPDVQIYYEPVQSVKPPIHTVHVPTTEPRPHFQPDQDRPKEQTLPREQEQMVEKLPSVVEEEIAKTVSWRTSLLPLLMSHTQNVCW